MDDDNSLDKDTLMIVIAICLILFSAIGAMVLNTYHKEQTVQAAFEKGYCQKAKNLYELCDKGLIKQCDSLAGDKNGNNR